MANWGKSTIGATITTVASGGLRATKFACPADWGTPGSYHVYADRSGAGSTYAVSAALYADSSGSPGALVSSSGVQVSANIARNTPAWYTVAVPTGMAALTPGANYWLCIWVGNSINLYSDAGATSSGVSGTSTYSSTTFPATFPSPSLTTSNWSMYLDYTPAVLTPNVPGAPSARAVSGTGMILDWSAPSVDGSHGAATGYDLDVATNATFTTFVTGYNNLNVGNALFEVVSGLALSTTYYVRLRAFNTGGTSASSSTTTQATAGAGAAIHTLVDNFNDNTRDTSLWSVGTANNENTPGNVTVSEVNQELEITPPTSNAASSYSGYYSNAVYNLTGDAAYVSVLAVTGAASADTEFQLVGDGANLVVWAEEGGSLFAEYTSLGSTTSLGSVIFNATTHAKWRIRHDSGAATLYWDTYDSSALTWTNRFSLATTSVPSLSLTTVIYQLDAGTYASTTPNIAKWDDVNGGVGDPFPLLYLYDEPMLQRSDANYRR